MLQLVWHLHSDYIHYGAGKRGRWPPGTSVARSTFLTVIIVLLRFLCRVYELSISLSIYLSIYPPSRILTPVVRSLRLALLFTVIFHWSYFSSAYYFYTSVHYYTTETCGTYTTCCSPYNLCYSVLPQVKIKCLHCYLPTILQFLPSTSFKPTFFCLKRNNFWLIYIFKKLK